MTPPDRCPSPSCPCLEPRGFRLQWTVYSSGVRYELAETLDTEASQ